MCTTYISKHDRKTGRNKISWEKNLITLKKLTMILVYLCFLSQNTATSPFVVMSDCHACSSLQLLVIPVSLRH